MKSRKKPMVRGVVEPHSGSSIRYCRCPKCKYKWRPRVEFPKSCPECKARLGWYRTSRL